MLFKVTRSPDEQLVLTGSVLTTGQIAQLLEVSIHDLTNAFGMATAINCPIDVEGFSFKPELDAEKPKHA